MCLIKELLTFLLISLLPAQRDTRPDRKTESERCLFSPRLFSGFESVSSSPFFFTWKLLLASTPYPAEISSSTSMPRSSSGAPRGQHWTMRPSIICPGSGLITITLWTSQTPQNWDGEKVSSGVWEVSGPEPEQARHPWLFPPCRQKACRRPPAIPSPPFVWKSSPPLAATASLQPFAAHARTTPSTANASPPPMTNTSPPPSAANTSLPPVANSSLLAAADSSPVPAPRKLHAVPTPPEHPPVPASRKNYVVTALPERPQVSAEHLFPAQRNTERETNVIINNICTFCMFRSELPCRAKL